MTTEDDFQAQLDLDPTDWITRLVLADFLDERGNPRGPGYRELGRRRVWPYLQKEPELWSWCSATAGKYYSITRDTGITPCRRPGSPSSHQTGHTGGSQTG